MSRRVRYTDESMGESLVMKGFLPPPSRLALKEDTVKVTIALSRASVRFFKRQARAHGTSYQRMIRRLIDLYASQYEKRA